MRKIAPYLIFIALTFLIGYGSALLSPPDEWYAALNKPWFNPPNWVFPIAWSLLYVPIGMAGARIWVSGMLGLPLLLWITQLGLNALWSYLFFNLQSPGLALVEVCFLFLAIIGFIRSAWFEERLASYFFIPYAAWVAFAAFLNAAIVTLN